MIEWNEVKVLDINSEFYRTKTSELMENAGKSVANFVINNFRIKNILVICGTGNNGGDGFVAARYLSRKFKVVVFLVGHVEEIKTVISKRNFNKLKHVELYDIDSLNKIDKLLHESELIIDAMLGVGLVGELKEPYKTIVEKINSLKDKTVISVDVPTGFGGSLAVKPNYTVTFHDKKKGMSKKNSGKIVVVDIGIPKKAIDYIGPGELIVYYPRPKKDSHKGENGRLLVIGGGPYYGAPALSSFAAQRTGVDLVYIATPKKVARAITSYSPLLIKPLRLSKEIAKLSPTLIVKELSDEEKLVPEDLEKISRLSEKADAILIGPGLGDDIDTQNAIEDILRLCKEKKKPMVIDADAIKVAGRNHALVKNSKTVVTPHSGEFKELTGIVLPKDLEEKKKHVKIWAKKLGITIALKGPIDIISDGSIVKLNDIHNEAMTVGGTGDVLAGVIGALLSKGVEPFNAARIGMFINGSAGNLAYKKRSYGLIATDLIDEIPNVLKKYL